MGCGSACVTWSLDGNVAEVCTEAARDSKHHQSGRARSLMCMLPNSPVHSIRILIYCETSHYGAPQHLIRILVCWLARLLPRSSSQWLAPCCCCCCCCCCSPTTAAAAAAAVSVISVSPVSPARAADAGRHQPRRCVTRAGSAAAAPPGTHRTCSHASCAVLASVADQRPGSTCHISHDEPCTHTHHLQSLNHNHNSTGGVSNGGSPDGKV
jgi:hypothetical protein